jgi:hypothetical protein
VVGQNHTTGAPVGNSVAQHLHCNLGLCSKLQSVRDLRFSTPCFVIGPGPSQVDLKINGELSLGRRRCETHSNLTVVDLARGPGVLALNSNRVTPLLDKSSVVNDPEPNRIIFGQRAERVVH